MTTFLVRGQPRLCKVLFQNQMNRHLKTKTDFLTCNSLLWVSASYCLANGETEARLWGTSYFALGPKHLQRLPQLWKVWLSDRVGSPKARRPPTFQPWLRTRGQEQTGSNRACLRRIKAQGWRLESSRRRRSLGAILTSCPHARSPLCLSAPERGL